MIFEGRVTSPAAGERWWEIRVDDLRVYTQGTSEKDAYEMIADALETVIDQPGFKVTVTPLTRGRFWITANNPSPMVARWLGYLRMEANLTIRDAAKRLGADSPEAWGRYEYGRSEPSLGKLMELIQAVAPERSIVVLPRVAAVRRLRMPAPATRRRRAGAKALNSAERANRKK